MCDASKDLPVEFVIPATKPAQILIEMVVDGKLDENGNLSISNASILLKKN